MSFKCKIGLHSWNGCKCSDCDKIRDEQHDWSHDCEECSRCGKTKESRPSFKNDHGQWQKSVITHDWSNDCEKCSKCGKSRDNQHNWSEDCEKCSKCAKTRENQHDWKGCKCSICNKTRNEQHNWKDNKCLKCGEINKETANSFRDSRDGKVYKTVKIGSQTWMAKNLAFKINSGCWAYDEKENNVEIYGYLYDWETAKKVCPVGWHLPSHKEWTTLMSYLGGELFAGGKLKESGTIHWLSPNFDATNETGFTGLPGGEGPSSHKFYDLGQMGNWWTSTDVDSGKARALTMLHKNAFLWNCERPKWLGLSVRLIKD